MVKWTPRIKAINTRARRKYLYGVTQADYDAQLAKQNGVCAICEGKNSPGKRLVIDHDHITHKFRGLLCDKCNMGIGMLRDSPAMLKVALAYLEGTK